MQFAYLTPVNRTDGGGLSLGTSTVQPHSLPKARTFLYLLHEQRRLWSIPGENLEWTLRTSVKLAPTATAISEVDEPNVVAVVAFRPNATIGRQPGLALVRNTFEANLLFEEWLEGSRRWLEQNPRFRNEVLAALD